MLNAKMIRQHNCIAKPQAGLNAPVWFTIMNSLSYDRGTSEGSQGSVEVSVA